MKSFGYIYDILIIPKSLLEKFNNDVQKYRNNCTYFSELYNQTIQGSVSQIEQKIVISVEEESYLYYLSCGVFGSSEIFDIVQYKWGFLSPQKFSHYFVLAFIVFGTAITALRYFPYITQYHFSGYSLWAFIFPLIHGLHALYNYGGMQIFNSTGEVTYHGYFLDFFNILMAFILVNGNVFLGIDLSTLMVLFIIVYIIDLTSWAARILWLIGFVVLIFISYSSKYYSVVCLFHNIDSFNFDYSSRIWNEIMASIPRKFTRIINMYSKGCILGSVSLLLIYLKKFLNDTKWETIGTLFTSSVNILVTNYVSKELTAMNERINR